MPGFLTIGVTIACFVEEGNTAESSKALTSLASIVAMVEPAAFTNHVGTGSRAHCLLGHRLSSRSISSVVTWLYDDKLVLHLSGATGSGTPAVEARMCQPYS